MLALLIGLLVPLSVHTATAVWLLPASAALAMLAPCRHPLARVLAAYGLGVIVCGVMVAHAMERRLPDTHSGETFVLTARVISLPRVGPSRQRFVVVPQRLDPSLPRLPRRIRLSWYGDGATVRAGETWRFEARLRRPRGFMNPVRFDYERWLASEHVDATGYVRSGERLAPANGLAGWRGGIAGHLAARAGHGDGAAVARALLVGDRRGFSEVLWRDLRRVGITHLVAISGLHIGLVAGLAGWAGGLGWRRLPGAVARVPTLVAGSLTGVTAGIVYAALAGFSLPTLRALVMAVVVAVALATRRRPGRTRGLVLAAVSVLVLDPWACLAPGFWLSFTAVTIIVFGWRGGASRLANTVRVQWLIGVLLAPVLLLWFGGFSWLGIPVNLIAVPLATVAVPAVFVAAVTDALWPVTDALARVSGALDHALAAVSWLAGNAGLVMPGPRPEWVWPVVGVAAVLCVLPRGFPGRWLALPLCALGVLAPAPRPAALEITFLEVGQGAATVVRTGGRVLVYDTGPSWGGGGSAARFTLIPFLREHGVARVDRLMVSHGDRDHAGGLAALRKALPVADVISGEPGETGGRPCRAGQHWRWGEVTFRVLAPVRSGLSGNAASCVLVMRAGRFRVLLTGDLPAAGEKRLLARLERPVDVLQVAHHGSDSSTTPQFLRVARPDVAVISAGHDNAYGLPSPAVIRRLRCVGARVVSLAQWGALTVQWRTDRDISMEQVRRTRLRLYHDRPSGVQAAGQNRYDFRRSRTGRYKEGDFTCGSSLKPVAG